jgi:hypothetical protein
MLGRDGAVMANVPYPLRNVMHKFIVGGRGATRAAQSAKDLRQSVALLAQCQQGSNWEAHEAWNARVSRGPGRKSRAMRGLNSVERLAPELG